MRSFETLRAPTAQRRTRGLPHAWRKGLFLGVLVILLSLCHGVVAPVDAPVPTSSAAATSAADEERSPFRDCAVSKRLAALSDRRGSVTVLDLPMETLGATAHVPEAARGLRVTPLPIPDNHRAFLQIFRI